MDGCRYGDDMGMDESFPVPCEATVFENSEGCKEGRL